MSECDSPRPRERDCPHPGLLGSLSPETRLLLAAAPADPDPARLEARLEAGVDWGRMLALLLRERAVLPFWRRVRPLARRIEPDAREGLDRLATVSEFRLGRLRTRLEETLDVLSGAGVEPLVLKGAALASTAYPDWRERPMSDLDLLVPGGRAEAARRALLESGWAWDEDAYPAEMYRRHYHLPPLEDTRGSGALVEIHTGLFLPGHPFSLDLEGIRRRALEADLGSTGMRVPHPVDHLLYVCLHFAWGHTLESGAWRTFRDVRALEDADGFDWRDLARRAEQAGGGPFVYWTLRLACAMGGVEMPEAIRSRFRPPLPGFALDVLERHLAAQLFVTEPDCPSVQLGRGLWLVATRPRGGRPEGIRPWSFTEDFRGRPTADASDRADPDVWARVWRHLSRPGPWTSYLARILAL